MGDWFGGDTSTASGWSYPGEYSIRLNAVAGQRYTVEVSPRGDSIGTAVMFGFIGGAIDAAMNENSGAFELKVVGPAGGGA